MKKMFFAALAATMMFASCNKEDISGNGGVGAEGPDTKMGLTITLPSTVNARDVNPEPSTVNATSEESTISTIYVFIYKNDGTEAKGNGTELSISDFTNMGGGVHELLDAKRVEATAGDRRIYVVANIPAGLTSIPATEGALKVLIEDWNTVAESWSMGSGGKFVMSSIRADKNLIAEEYDVPASSSVNVLNVDLNRIMSKVTVTASAPGSKLLQKFDAIPGLELEYFVEAFTTGQVAKTAYLIQNINPITNLLVTPDNNRTGHVPSDAVGKASFVNVTPSDGGIPTLPTMNTFKYIGENYPESGTYNDATYVMIRTHVAPNRVASADASGTITWAAASFTAGDDLWMVRSLTLGSTWFCKSETDADVLGSALSLAKNGNHGSGEVEIYKYNGAKVYFTALINHDRPAGKEGVVYRNQYIQIDVTAIRDNVFKGMPGNPTDTTGDTPPDPEDPKNPDPWEPTDPIVEPPAGLHLNVTVAPWNYIANEIILQ